MEVVIRVEFILRRLTRVFGLSFWKSSQWYERQKVMGFFYLLVPFPRDPLRFILFIRKLGLFPLLHAPVTISQWIVSWVWLQVDLGLCDVFVMTMITFVYLKSYEMQPCTRSLCKCVYVQKCHYEWGQSKASSLILFWS